MTHRILLIEDDPASMELMLYLLKSFGFTTSFAFNAEDGMRLAGSIAPDLILCDIKMPEVSGAAFIRAIKQLQDLKHIPVVAVTGMAMEGDEDGLLALGFDGYLAKPIDPYQLHAQLVSYLNCESS